VGSLEKRDNYLLQLQQAKRLFLTYDQQELIRRCRLTHDDGYFYVTFLSAPYRICRHTGDLERQAGGQWRDANSFAEVMTLLDWLCDSKPDRYITGRYLNIVTQGHHFHRSLQELPNDPDADYFAQRPEAFRRACEALGGVPMPGGDVGYALELLDGVRVYVKLWLADEEFPAKLVYLWEENVLQYLRYETTWYAAGLLTRRIRENM